MHVVLLGERCPGIHQEENIQRPLRKAAVKLLRPDHIHPDPVDVPAADRDVVVPEVKERIFNRRGE
jgi:hypothetical protein